MPREAEYTSFRIKDRELWKKVKIRAIESNMGISEFVEKKLTEDVKNAEGRPSQLVEKASSILQRLQNRDFAVTGGMEVVMFSGKGRKRKENLLATDLSIAMTRFEKALSEKDVVASYHVEEWAMNLMAMYNKGIASNAITEGPGLMSKIDQLTKENERLLSDNARLLKENEQLRSTLQNVSTAYEDFSAKNR